MALVAAHINAGVILTVTSDRFAISLFHLHNPLVSLLPVPKKPSVFVDVKQHICFVSHVRGAGRKQYPWHHQFRFSTLVLAHPMGR